MGNRGAPRTAEAVVEGGIDEFDGGSSAITGDGPGEADFVVDLIDDGIGGIAETNCFASGIEIADKGAEGGDAEGYLERDGVFGDDEIATGGESGAGGEGEVDGAAEPPIGDVL